MQPALTETVPSLWSLPPLSCSMLLILTNSADATVDHFLRSAKLNAGSYARLDTDHFVERGKVTFKRWRQTIDLDGISFSPGDVTGVWFRRPGPLVRTVERATRAAVVEGAWAESLEGFLGEIPPERWINHPAANSQASHKTEQLSRARKYGLAVPESLVTQDANDLREFWRHCDGRVVVKPLAVATWGTGSATRVVYTSEMRAADLDDLSLLESCPCFFQQRVDKALDVRVTVIDDALFPVGLRAFDHGASQRLDIRRNNMADVIHGAVSLPSETESSLRRLIRSYGLRYAAVDLAKDSEGCWWFFEVNPSGQWAWLEESGCMLFTPALSRALRFAA